MQIQRLKPLVFPHPVDELTQLEETFTGSVGDFHTLDSVIERVTFPNLEPLAAKPGLANLTIQQHAIDAVRRRMELYTRKATDVDLHNDLRTFIYSGYIGREQTTETGKVWHVEHHYPIWDRMRVVLTFEPGRCTARTVADSKYGRSGQESLNSGTGQRLAQSVLLMGEFTVHPPWDLLGELYLMETAKGMLWGFLYEDQEGRVYVGGMTAHEILDFLVLTRGRVNSSVTHVIRLAKRFDLDRPLERIEPKALEAKAQGRGIRISKPQRKLLGTHILRSLAQRLQGGDDEDPE